LGALIWSLVRRARQAQDSEERRRDAPVWYAGGAPPVSVLALLATNVAPEDGTLDDYLFAASLVPLATVPYAFWIGVLRSRLWRGSVAAAGETQLDADPTQTP